MPSNAPTNDRYADPTCQGCLGRGVWTYAEHLELVCINRRPEDLRFDVYDEHALATTRMLMDMGYPARDVP